MWGQEAIASKQRKRFAYRPVMGKVSGKRPQSVFTKRRAGLVSII